MALLHLEAIADDGGEASSQLETPRFNEDLDSPCSSAYVDAPSSPGRAGYFFSAPASPMHYVLSSAAARELPHHRQLPDDGSSSSFSFEVGLSSRLFSSGDGDRRSVANGSMSSADELFFNGQIRPMRLSSHQQRPRILAPLMDIEAEEEESEDRNAEAATRGRDLRLRSKSLHRKARSLSPLREVEFGWREGEDEQQQKNGQYTRERELRDRILEEFPESGDSKESEAAAFSMETSPSCSISSSRSSSTGRNSKKWIFLKDLLYRSKSEGRGHGKEKFWSTIAFTPLFVEKKHAEAKPQSDSSDNTEAASNTTNKEWQKKTKNRLKEKQKEKESRVAAGKKVSAAARKPVNGVARKRRVPASAHELHYTANRAQAEEMKKRTFLPYRQGLLGCLGFSSKGYSALNGLAKSLNPVSPG